MPCSAEKTKGDDDERSAKYTITNILTRRHPLGSHVTNDEFDAEPDG